MGRFSRKTPPMIILLVIAGLMLGFWILWTGLLHLGRWGLIPIRLWLIHHHCVCGLPHRHRLHPTIRSRSVHSSR